MHCGDQTGNPCIPEAINDSGTWQSVKSPHYSHQDLNTMTLPLKPTNPVFENTQKHTGSKEPIVILLHFSWINPCLFLELKTVLLLLCKSVTINILHNTSNKTATPLTIKQLLQILFKPTEPDG
jgi:hypothetical protein